MPPSPPRKRGPRLTNRSATPPAIAGSAAQPRVLQVAAEIYPWVRSGGLGDVIAALPPALAALGVDVRLVLPGFAPLLDALQWTEVVRLRTPFFPERVRLLLATLPESVVELYLVDHPPFYDRLGSPYQSS